MNSAALALVPDKSSDCPTKHAPSHFLSDCIIHRAAESAGYNVTRRTDITLDVAQLPAEYFKKTPDYGKIRLHLEQGINVPGAQLTREVQYILQRHRSSNL